ncbi:hypothetical protein JCM16303_001739 [Sporobolomyces ruberrimus]
MSGAPHLRRRSSAVPHLDSSNEFPPSASSSNKVPPSPYLDPRRQPELSRPPPVGSWREKKQPVIPSVTSAATRILSITFRLLRNPYSLVLISFCSLILFSTSYVHRNSSTLSKRPLPPSLLPILRHSSNAVAYLHPATGQKLKDWHDYQVKSDPNRPLTPDEIEQRSRHTFHPNGLLLVNSRGKHPIHELIEKAEKKWKDKVAKQSRTLSEAVAEYKQRYRRNPPKGFDDWWAFCEKHHVQLRDEYDQIAHDLAPHWALEASDSRHRNRVMQERDHTFTAAFHPGIRETSLHGPYSDLKRASDVAELLSLFAGRMHRELNITFIIDDNPAVMLPYAQRERMVELGQQGDYYGPSEWTEPEDSSLSNFAKACAPNSPLRRSERGEFVADYSGEAQRSFIWSHAKTADVCHHPEFRKLHGHTMGQGVPLGPLVPLFTFAKTKLQSDILSTPLEQYEEHYIGYDPPWEGKSQNKLLWRGSTTGVEFDRHTPWRLSQRARLHIMSHETEGDRAVIWSQRGKLRESNISAATLNQLYMDTSFSGDVQQCDEETCELIRNTMEFKPTIGIDESNTYKYFIDVDGNGWSGRFHRLMSTRSVLLKSTAFPEWYQDRVQEWVHYIPLKIDYSDLYDIMAFFIGTPDGQGGHDSLAEKIGASGKRWAKEHWRKADMAAYMYRLCLEYARILYHDEQDVDFVESINFDLS